MYWLRNPQVCFIISNIIHGQARYLKHHQNPFGSAWVCWWFKARIYGGLFGGLFWLIWDYLSVYLRLFAYCLRLFEDYFQVIRDYLHVIWDNSSDYLRLFFGLHEIIWILFADYCELFAGYLRLSVFFLDYLLDFMRLFEYFLDHSPVLICHDGEYALWTQTWLATRAAPQHPATQQAGYLPRLPGWLITHHRCQSPS